MTVEEDRLARWLKDGTPDPPIALLADDIVRRAARRQRARTWTPVLAAACVVLAVALLVTAVAERHGAGPSGRSADPTVATTDHRTSPPHRTGSLDVHPWKARVLSPSYLQENSLDAFRGRLYAYQGDTDQRLVRLDPQTGRVLARTTFAVDPDPESQPGLANGLVWSVRDFGASIPTKNRFAVVGLNLDTLRVEAQTAYVEPNTLVRSNDRELLISSGRHVFLNPAFPAERTFTPAGPVSDLALSPDGSSILELTGPQIDRTVSTQDVASKGFTSATDLGSGAGSLRATARGFFVTTSTGMAARTNFYASGHGQPRTLTSGGGGVDPVVTVSAGVAWAGGSDTLACVDPATGQIRAHVNIGGNKAAISGLTALNGKLYAVYHGLNAGPREALIEMTPPKACGLS